MTQALPVLAHKIAETTSAVFGHGPLTQAVHDACQRYAHDLANIQAGRGINALLIAIVGAKGQGKTWSARQFIRDERVRELLRTGDLLEDATTQLVWIGPVAPAGLEPESEVYHHCPANHLAHIGQPYVILDTPGLTDVDHRAAQLAEQALSLAPLKLLIIARDQMRAAANLTIAHQIDGAICIPIVNSVEPEEMSSGDAAAQLSEDLRTLRAQLEAMAPHSTIMREVLVPDFEITGDEPTAGQVFLSGVLDRINELGVTVAKLGKTREQRGIAAGQRLREEVTKLIEGELPQLATAVNQLKRETEHLPERVLDSLLGSEAVLATGIRMRLRARLVSDTSLLWFPYRTMMSTLNLTQGAWDRVMLALSGSVPSLFGALASWARNVQLGREFTSEMQDGIRRRMQQQVEQRVRPLCSQFHRALLKLRPRGERSLDAEDTTVMRLSGIEEFQSRSQQIFDSAIEQNAVRGLWVQLIAAIGIALFWACMAGPIALIYREYFVASYDVFAGVGQARLDDFPHPTASLIFTSLLLSLLPLAIYCMVVMALVLSRRKIQGVAKEIINEHQRTIEELKSEHVIRLEFEDQLLQQAEFLLSLDN